MLMKLMTSKKEKAEARQKHLDVMEICGEARAETGGALKHYSDTVHYYSTLFHKGIHVFGGAFAHPTLNVALLLMVIMFDRRQVVADKLNAQTQKLLNDAKELYTTVEAHANATIKQ
jgi:hypothetical protein